MSGGAQFDEHGGEEVQTASLDEYMDGQAASFIALDIEGAELTALFGAERIIREQKPKLAICVYHKPEDLYEIPELVKKLRPDYQLYLRHYHSLDMLETVLYAF